MSILISANNLRKTYGTGESAVHALRGVSVEFEAGSFTAVTGTSGSGKSTLLHLLGGLDSDAEGSVLFGGKDILKMNDDTLSEFRRVHIGYVFQFFNLVPELTARENILLPLLIGNEKPDEAFLSKLTDLLGISQRLSYLPAQLSGGQQQRAAIARALIRKPEVLLCDEPTGNLDSASGQEVVSLLRQLREENGQTIIMVTHDPNIAQQADRVIRIEDGMICE